MVLGIIILYRKRLFVRGKRKWFWISTSVFFGTYLFIVGGATYADLDAQWTLNKFDLNQDGFFNGDEITTEQNKAMMNSINDIGRNFSFITGLIFSGIIAMFVLIVGKITESIMKRIKTDS